MIGFILNFREIAQREILEKIYPREQARLQLQDLLL